MSSGILPSRQFCPTAPCHGEHAKPFIRHGFGDRQHAIAVGWQIASLPISVSQRSRTVSGAPFV